MKLPTLTPKRIARTAAGFAGISGILGFLSLMGAFGPVSCWTGGGASGTSNGTTTTASRGCVSGIDYLGGATGNAPVLFFWAVVLLVLTGIGASAAWTGHRYTTWLTAVAGVVVSILGLMSIGWYFVLPTLCLMGAGVALTIDARRAGGQP